ncbi:MAG: saccharopine dehydrogenase NADP-binding domain-containing protein [Wenzhouxiangellaceae bacterium]
MSQQWMIYGANGYTGELTARAACERGLQPVLSGRNEAQVKALAEELSLPWRCFDLDDPQVVAEQIGDMVLVLHCAGPFSVTSAPMVNACIERGVHYLDITGEIDVFAACHDLDGKALAAAAVVIPGVGFDVVPTDCLAMQLSRALPQAVELELAFAAGGGLSPGTAKTSVEGLGKGGRIRQGGQLTSVPLGWQTRDIPFADGAQHAVTIPWGDVYTAFVSTAIPNIKVYTTVPPSSVSKLRRLRWLRPLLALRPVQRLLQSRVGAKVRGPNADKRQRSRCQIWGQVRSADGKVVSAELETPNGYELTVSASLGIVAHLLTAAESGDRPSGGYYTPSMLMGPDYITSLPGVRWVKQPTAE